MANPFLAEIRIFAGNFPPKGWAFCDGQILPISQNTALFSLLGTNYGGDGKATFGLPNLQGMAPLQAGQGPGLSFYDLGQTGGSETVSLIMSEMPSHNHALNAANAVGTQLNPASQQLATGLGGSKNAANVANIYSSNTSSATTPLNYQAISYVGGGAQHNNMMPYLGLTFIIALTGVYPARP